MVGSGAGPAKGPGGCARVLPAPASDGHAYYVAAELAKLGDLKQLQAWYAPAADGRCPARCDEYTACSACAAQRDRALHGMPQVSFLSCTVTIYANLAHNLTRSP
jgi:hypothetical protein